MDASPSTEFVEVPRKWAPEIRRYLGYLASLPPEEISLVPLPAAASLAASELYSFDDYPLWDDDEVIALANAGTITAVNYRRIMDAIVENGRVGEWVSIGELSEWTGITYKKAANFRTQLYRWLHAHTHHQYAPFTGTWGANVQKGKRVVLYRVSADCAAQWERIRPQLDD
jgi:hypothetical protein